MFSRPWVAVSGQGGDEGKGGGGGRGRGAPSSQTGPGQQGEREGMRDADGDEWAETRHDVYLVLPPVPASRLSSRRLEVGVCRSRQLLRCRDWLGCERGMQQ